MLPLPLVYSRIECNASRSNYTWEHCPSPLDLEARALLPLTLVALLLNLWALFVFARQSGSNTLLFWIVALCASEFSPTGATPALFHSGAILQILALAALFYRNWSFAVLAAVRFEAVVRVTAQRLVTRSRSRRLAVAMATLSLAINFVRGLRVKAVYCTSSADAVVLPFLYERAWFFYFEAYVAGLLQTVVPLLCTTILSAVTVARLVARRRNNQQLGLRRHVTAAPDGGGGGGAAGGDGSSGEEKRIQTMVMFLCLTFLVCETPVFILYNLEHFFGIYSLFWISNACIVVDSISNFVSYILTNSRFRRSVFRCLPRSRAGAASFNGGGGRSLILTQRASHRPGASAR